MLSLEERFLTFPPIACRLLARTGSRKSVRLLEDEEIAETSGLPLFKVRSLSWLCSWDGVPVDEMMAFSKGCGVDFSDSRCVAKHKSYARFVKRPFSYIDRHPQSDHFYRMHLSYTRYLETLYPEYSTQD